MGSEMCIRDRISSNGASEVKLILPFFAENTPSNELPKPSEVNDKSTKASDCLLYTSDAADERSSVDLGGRRIIKKKKKNKLRRCVIYD